MSGNSSKKIAFNYFGGKFTFLEELYQYFPSAAKFNHLIDLFAGSMVVSLNYNHKGNIIKTANEINEDITNFFQVLRDNPETLIHLLELTPCSYAEYHKAWERSENNIEQARRFYTRVRQSFFGLGAQRKNKGWHMAKQQANASGGETVSRWNNSIDKLIIVAKTLRENFQITNFDYKECLKKIDHPRAFFYCDPPYPRESRASYNDYKFEFTEEDHINLSMELHSISGRAMVSGYDCDLLNDLYHNWEKRYLTKKKNNIRSGEVQEVVWMNYSPPLERRGIQKTLFK